MQLKQQALQLQGQKVSGDLQLKKEQIDLDSATKSDAQMLDESQFAEQRRMNQWDQRMDLAEYQIEKTQRRPASIN